MSPRDDASRARRQFVVDAARTACGMGLLGLWAIYRIARGWMRLSSREAMPD